MNSSAADQLAPLDTWASITMQRATPLYRAPSAKTMSIFDPAANTFADWTPPPIQDRQQPNYTPPRSRVTPPSDFATILDTWAATAFGRATPYYKGQRAITIPVFDPATNTFADWTPAALLSRSVQDYAPPRARTFGSFGLSIITDQIAPVAQSRAQAFYRSPLSQVLAPSFSPAAPDTYTSVTASRSVPLYRSPASFLARAYDQLAVALGTDYAAPAQSRASTYYRGSYSLVSNAADQDAPETFGTDWVSVAQSRIAQRILGKSVITPVFFAPPAVFGTQWTSVFQSRPSRWYSARSWMGQAWTLGSGVDPGPPPPQPDPYVPNLAGYGGGGFGAVMADDFFKRYDARYKPRYAGRYKPTIRKQKP